MVIAGWKGRVGVRDKVSVRAAKLLVHCVPNRTSYWGDVVVELAALGAFKFVGGA